MIFPEKSEKGTRSTNIFTIWFSGNKRIKVKRYEIEIIEEHIGIILKGKHFGERENHS